MIIPLFATLETRDEWLSLLKREQAYGLVRDEAVLVDFQDTFLQLTLLRPEHTDPICYTLGSRTTTKPAWEFIKRCHWSLHFIVNGLQSMNFSGNVRDNQGFYVPEHLSVRKSFVRETRLQRVCERLLLQPASDQQQATLHPTALLVAQHLRDDHYTDWLTLNPKIVTSAHAAMISMFTEPSAWQFDHHGEQLTLYFHQRPCARCRLISRPPNRHLRDKARVI